LPRRILRSRRMTMTCLVARSCAGPMDMS
jgi:hypothetical protein